MYHVLASFGLVINGFVALVACLRSVPPFSARLTFISLLDNGSPCLFSLLSFDEYSAFFISILGFRCISFDWLFRMVLLSRILVSLHTFAFVSWLDNLCYKTPFQICRLLVTHISPSFVWGVI